jgi:chemotaxis protein MotB
MTHPARFACLAAAALFASPAMFSADSAPSDNPPVKIERAPESDSSHDATTRAENERLSARVAELEKTVSVEKARADEALARLNTLSAGVDRMLDEKNSAEAKLAKATETETALRQKLDAAEKAAATGSPEVAAKLADTENKLATSLRSYAALQAENQLLKTSSADQVRLAAELEKMRQEKATREAAEPTIADLKSKLAESDNKLSTALNSYSMLQKENEQLKSGAAQHASESDEVEKLRREKSELEAKLAAVPANNSAEIQQELAEAWKKLNQSEKDLAQARAETEKLRAASEENSKLTAEIENLRSEKASLEGRLSSAPSADTAGKLNEAESKLETTLHSYAQLQAENERLKSAGADQQKLETDLENLRRENAALQAKASAPADNSALAEVQDRLSTVLRSYTLLQQENDHLKADADRALEKERTSASQAASQAAAQTSALFDELRQTKAQAAALATENSQLKTKLALASPPPGSLLASPTRPGSAQAQAASTPAPAATPTAAPAARTHVVVAGDTLAKISRQYYGTPGRWDEILKANSDVVKNENALPVGATLKIP